MWTRRLEGYSGCANLNLGNLVIVESYPVLKVAMLFIRVFVRPDGILEIPACSIHGEVMRLALERTFCRRRRPFQFVHPNLGAGEIVTNRMVIFFHANN